MPDQEPISLEKLKAAFEERLAEHELPIDISVVKNSYTNERSLLVRVSPPLPIKEMTAIEFRECFQGPRLPPHLPRLHRPTTVHEALEAGHYSIRANWHSLGKIEHRRIKSEKTALRLVDQSISDVLAWMRARHERAERDAIKRSEIDEFWKVVRERYDEPRIRTSGDLSDVALTIRRMKGENATRYANRLQKIREFVRSTYPTEKERGQE